MQNESKGRGARHPCFAPCLILGERSVRKKIGVSSLTRQGTAEILLKVAKPEDRDKAQQALQQTFERILNDPKLMALIHEAASTYNIPAQLIAAVLAKESAGKVNARSRGSFQFGNLTSGAD